MLVVVVAVQIGVVVVQVPVPGVVCGVLGSTPPDAVVAKVVERTCVVTVATRKGRKKSKLSFVVQVSLISYNLL